MSLLMPDGAEFAGMLLQAEEAGSRSQNMNRLYSVVNRVMYIKDHLCDGLYR